MDSRYTQSVKTSILKMEVGGYVILPITLRHRLILEDIESPAVFTDKVMSPQDLITAIKILSTHNLEEMLTLKVKEQDSILLLKFLNDNDYYLSELGKLTEYISMQENHPVIWDKKEKKSKTGINLILSCITGLMKIGLTYEQAWTMPESEAIWMYVSNAISEGAEIVIITDDDIKAMELAQKLSEQYKKNK